MAEGHTKEQRLKQDGALHPHAVKVTAELITQAEFFDARDLVQMKYEMLRSVNVDDSSVTAAACAFGLSRVAFYRARQQYHESGLPGLLPQKRGPRGPHKLTDAVMAFLHQQLEGAETPPDWALLSRQIEARFGTKIHPRSIERAVRERGGGGR